MSTLPVRSALVAAALAGMTLLATPGVVFASRSDCLAGTGTTAIAACETQIASTGPATDLSLALAQHLQKAIQYLVDHYGEYADANYRNVIILTDNLVDRYKAYDFAETVYRHLIAAAPDTVDAHYSLAAVLQMKGDARAGLKIIDDFTRQYGKHKKLETAREILNRALSQEADQ